MKPFLSIIPVPLHSRKAIAGLNMLLVRTAHGTGLLKTRLAG